MEIFINLIRGVVLKLTLNCSCLIKKLGRDEKHVNVQNRLLSKGSPGLTQNVGVVCLLYATL